MDFFSFQPVHNYGYILVNVTYISIVVFDDNCQNQKKKNTHTQKKQVEKRTKELAAGNI